MALGFTLNDSAWPIKPWVTFMGAHMGLPCFKGLPAQNSDPKAPARNSLSKLLLQSLCGNEFNPQCSQ